MASIKNMGTATMKFGQGLIVTGSYESKDTSLTVSGSIKIGLGSKDYTLPVQDGNLDQVLTTDGSGTVIWADQQAAPTTKAIMVHLASDFTVSTSTSNEHLSIPFSSVQTTTFAGADFNTSNYTFTAPEEGFYFINCSLYLTSIDTSVAQYQLRISSSADWGFAGDTIAFRNYFPGAMAETTVQTLRLDRLAHLSGSDEVKITLRPIAAAGSYGTITAYPHISYLTIHKI